jgi:hypothetical protein
MIHISLGQYGRTIFERVIALSDLEYLNIFKFLKELLPFSDLEYLNF